MRRQAVFWHEIFGCLSAGFSFLDFPYSAPYDRAGHIFWRSANWENLALRQKTAYDGPSGVVAARPGPKTTVRSSKVGGVPWAQPSYDFGK